MSDHAPMTADNDAMDLAEHESTYASFVSLTEVSIVFLLSIILELVLWGLKGHGFIALIGFVVASAAATFGALTGLTWRAVLPVFLLLGLACIVL